MSAAVRPGAYEDRTSQPNAELAADIVREHPEGIRLADVAEEMGLAERREACARHLRIALKQGLIRAEGKTAARRYFPASPSSSTPRHSPAKPAAEGDAPPPASPPPPPAPDSSGEQGVASDISLASTPEPGPDNSPEAPGVVATPTIASTPSPGGFPRSPTEAAAVGASPSARVRNWVRQNRSRLTLDDALALWAAVDGGDL